MKNIKKIVAGLIFSLVIIMLFSLTVLAAGPSGGGGNPGVIKVNNPLSNADTVQEFIMILINNVLIPIGGIVIAVAVIYSGFLFVTAQGNETKLATAKRAFMYTVIGAAILLGAWAIETIITNTINSITN